MSELEGPQGSLSRTSHSFLCDTLPWSSILLPGGWAESTSSWVECGGIQTVNIPRTRGLY